MRIGARAFISGSGGRSRPHQEGAACALAFCTTTNVSPRRRRGVGLPPQQRAWAEWEALEQLPSAFTKPCQKHDLAIGKLERVKMDVKHALVDLAKDRNGVAGVGTKHRGGLIRDWLFEREFGTRKHADSHRTILRRGESSRASAEVVLVYTQNDTGWFWFG